MMNFDLSRVAAIKRRLYVTFGVLCLAVLTTLANEATRLVGLGLVMVTLPFALVMCGYLVWSSSQSERPIGKWDFHPSRGVLLEIPDSLQRALLHLLVYAAVAGVCLYGIANGFPGDTAKDIAGTRVWSAAFLIFIVLVYEAELLAMVVVRRWGFTPPTKVIVGLLLVMCALHVATGLPLTLALVAHLTVVNSSSAQVGNLMLVLPVTMLVIAVSVWVRDATVTKWKRRLEDQERLTREAEQGRKLAEAQLAMLQAQIEPHFLFNTLASVQYLVKRDAGGADFLLTQLVRYLRHAMPKMRQRMSTLGQEFELADAFLQIARMRMGGRLTVSVELAERLSELVFPPLVLQTLVENALKHGVEPKLGPVSISVRADTEAGTDGVERLVVGVTDNGVGLGRANTQGTGAGLINIRERLAGIYGHSATLVVVDLSKGGVSSRVVMQLPLLTPSSATPA
jgi:hypothetical protein